MNDGIFISYRRSDSQHAAGRLADALVREFGDRHIFRDIEDIEAGADFIDTLDGALASCAIMLVVIGPQWLELRDAQSGARRLDEPDDWVRQEISRALQRGIRVIPVLLERSNLPPAGVLPDDLKALVRRQAIRLADAQWPRDVDALVAALRPQLAVEATAPPPWAAPAASPRSASAPSLASPATGTGPALGSRIESGMRTGLTWARRILLGLGLTVLLLVFLMVRACNDAPPDLSGRWTSAEGWTLDFQPKPQSPQQRADGETSYAVTGVAGGGARLECDAMPAMFGSVDLDCRFAPGSPSADSFTCSGMYIGSSPTSATGDCKWQRDGSTRKLTIKR